MKSKCLLPFYPFVAFVVATANSGLAAQTSNDLESNIAPEIRRIIEGNQWTLDAVYSIQGVIKSVKTCSFAAGTRQLAETTALWSDTDHLRKDLLESQFVGENTTPLFLGKVHKGGDSYDSFFKPHAPGGISIHSVECRFEYRSPGKTAHVNAPRWDPKYILVSNEMLYYQSVLGHTLREKVLESLQKGYGFTTKTETIEGDDCVLLSCDYPDIKMKLNVWVVPSKGYCIKKMQNIYGGTVYHEYTTNLKEYAPNIWWFSSVNAASHATDIKSTDLRVESLILNEPIDPNVFTLAGTPIPRGTKIMDHIAGTTYVYGMGFQLAEEDVDLALEALENAKTASGDHATATPPNTLPTESTESMTDERENHRASPGPERVNLGQSDVSRKAQAKWLPVLLVGLALVILAGLALLKGKKVCAK